METSDSEYFESADEDFESDYEDCKKHPQNIRHHDSHKIEEPELCKLRIDEKHESSFATQKSASNKEKDDKVITQDNNKNIQTSKTTLEITETSNNQYNETVVHKDHKSDLKETTPENFIANIENFKNKKELNNIVNAKQEIILIEKVNQPVLETAKIEPERDEDNLWDDDELDWGSEATKEESQRKVAINDDNPKKPKDISPLSKNEDSGWDDFDADWDSDAFANSNTTSDTLVETNKLLTISQSTTKENLFQDDEEWEPLEKPEAEKPKETESSWGGWGNWGVSSLLNTASTLTNHVSQGLSTVLENGIGIPEPEEMARINKMKMENDTKDSKIEDNNSPVGFGLENFVSGVTQLTKFVESTGTKVITGGLDTLEAIGKKTVEVLQEGDPGLKKKRAFLKLDSGKTNLSQILREAKERAEQEHQELAQRHSEIKRIKNYEALFDDHQGLVHLEALEMLSKLCLIKLDNLNNSLSGDSLKDMQETLEQVKELCELPEEEEDDKIIIDAAKEIISNAVKEINIPISYEKFFTVFEEIDKWLENVNLKIIDDTELHQQAIETLAHITALAVEQFHKTGELLLVKEHRSTADEADSLVQITATMKSLILKEAGKFTDKLSMLENFDKDNISEHITNIFYEAANSGRYIQDAFQLLLPVLQVGAV